jgi:hypothetical protein
MKAKARFETEVKREHMPTVPAVRFLGLIRGRHTCEAILKEEVYA